jgi:rod shape-determining protein MreD
MALTTIASPARARTDKFAARLLPAATTILAALLQIQPVHVPGYAALTPALIVMTVYHWTTYRPDLLPALALFAIGLGYDLVAGAPLGVTSLTLLILRAVVLRYRGHFVRRSFPYVWAGFTLVTLAVMFGLWALHSALGGAVLDLRTTVFRAVLTISLFPVASFLLGRAQRALMPAR